MELNSFRTLGRSGLRVSPITLGAMTFGDGSWGADDQTSTALLDRYLDAGGNCIDTANLASLQITIPDPQLAELGEMTRPQLEFPAELLENIAPSYQQAGATINGVESSQFHR